MMTSLLEQQQVNLLDLLVFAGYLIIAYQAVEEIIIIPITHVICTLRF